jgi:hypothetical protein
MSTTSVPTLLRQQVDRWAQTWLTAKFSRLLQLRAQDPGPFNYPISVFSEWRGKGPPRPEVTCDAASHRLDHGEEERLSPRRSRHIEHHRSTSPFDCELKSQEPTALPLRIHHSND